MTKEEAITYLKVIWNRYKAEYEIERETLDAYHMAIEALSADSQTDLISRADAIKAVEQEYKIDRGYMVDDYTYGFNQAIHYVSDIILPDLPSADAEWILCSERLPKEDEYVGNVCKYYLIQDEYGDMHVAHLSGRGWETIESVKALGCDVVAWMPLPKPYREDGE